MRKIMLAAAMAFALSGCANFQADVTTFTNNVVAVNTAIGTISASLAQNCGSLEATAQSLSGLSSALDLSSKAKAGLAAANAALSTWCAAPPTDIPSAIAATAAEVAAAKAAYQTALNGG